MDIKDLAGLSKPLTRLIDVVSDGIGAVSRPYLIRRDAAARADEIRLIAGALKEVAEQHQLPVTYRDGEIEVWQKPEDNTLTLEATTASTRALSRLDFQERKRQANIENVTSVAAAELTGEVEVPEEKPDEDWVTRFFSAAQDISSEQMQDLWGRILAGEILRPGTYSLRALEAMKNLTAADATLFQEVGGLTLLWNGNAAIGTHDKEWLRLERKIYPGHHFQLGELGAAYPTDLMWRAFRDESIQDEVFVSGEMILLVERGEIKSEIQLPIWKFTAVGKELLNLIPVTHDEEYLETLGKFFLNRNGIPSLCKILEHLPDGQLRYEVIRKIVAEEPQGDVESSENEAADS